MSVNFNEVNLWVQLEFSDDRDGVDIFGNGEFTVNVRRHNRLTPVSHYIDEIDEPTRIVYFLRELPPLTTIKIFDKSNNLVVHIFTSDRVEIK
ncbi:MAG: hypothetical protein ACTSU9_02040 [Promethearchaeota archaeon]